MIHVMALVKECLTPILNEYALIYFIIVFLTSIVGGVDEKLATLIIVILITILAKLLYKKKIEFKNYIKIYLIISLGYLLDLIFNLSTSLRDYMIIYYTYNTFTEAFNLFSEDKKIKLPSQFQQIVNKFKKE